MIRKNEAKSKVLNNSKAKDCIIKAFALANIWHPNIDFVIETLFYTY